MRSADASARELVEGAQAAGTLRPDVTAEDLLMLFNGVIPGIRLPR